MIVFEYRALQPDGAIAEGTLEAEGRQDALRRMAASGLRPVRLNERPRPAEKTDSAGFSLRIQPRKITGRMLEDFTRLLSSLLAAGIPLSRALVILYKEAAAPIASQKWKEVHDLVIDGLSLADAMAQSPQVFPRVYVAMVEAGETGGFLDVVLGQIADFQARDKELRSKMLTALLYPTILLVLAIGVLTFLLVFFIPRFQVIFEGFGGSLPLITQVIVGASTILRSYGLVVAVVAAVVFFMLRNWLRSPQGSRIREQLILKAPVVGALVSKFAMARFCRMLGTLLGAGVPLINGLQVARRSIGNQTLIDAVSASIERVQKGEPLGVSLAGCPTLFGGAVLEMISVAEESGRLDQELVRLANVTESELDRQLKTAVALAEPLMLFFIAGFIGTIFIGMVIPIFTIQDYIK
ncbi:MAG TPA: type II secretion system F family protein [Candidatus Paceibacterota bacterium]|nr:type II secretion system F family protein [Verrucomicrobiota bacterium]HOX02938.1 type II secretion system F family protein [Verrucomicrobiota bacterium]HRZ45690.1 type II secretion system F family protein [Candidatus Paceibacterota bacterium]HRZ93328.1 type II secretion system F family protein [Candidatus Paceibacterota bacterium]